MIPKRSGWIHAVGGTAGLVLLLGGIWGLQFGFSLLHSFLAVLGFLVISWAALDYRKFRRGTQESEVEGGRTIE